MSLDLVVITAPAFFEGEAEILRGLLAAGLTRLHIRKPAASPGEVETLLKKVAPGWQERLVLHGSADLANTGGDEGMTAGSLAKRYGIPQIHCPVKEWRQLSGEGSGPGKADQRSPAVSVSLHSWEEMATAGDGLAYVFMSPLFDSISKPGYKANTDLLKRPAGPLPCKVIGLGGIDADTIRTMIRHGWEGAAVLGWLWEDPQKAIGRLEQLRRIIENVA